VICPIGGLTGEVARKRLEDRFPVGVTVQDGVSVDAFVVVGDYSQPRA
jgi:hypothetical protein